MTLTPPSFAGIALPPALVVEAQEAHARMKHLTDRAGKEVSGGNLLSQATLDELVAAATHYHDVLERVGAPAPVVAMVAAMLKEWTTDAAVTRMDGDVEGGDGDGDGVVGTSSTELVPPLEADGTRFVSEAFIKASGGRIWFEDGPEGVTMGITEDDGSRVPVSRGATYALAYARIVEDPEINARFRAAMVKGVRQQLQ